MKMEGVRGREKKREKSVVVGGRRGGREWGEGEDCWREGLLEGGCCEDFAGRRDGGGEMRARGN
jgi:hypothetical protein